MNAEREYLAAGYVLGGLTREEEELARSLEISDPEFQAELESYRETMALVGESDEPVVPSAETESAILGIPDRHPRSRAADSTAADSEDPRPAPEAAAPERAARERRRRLSTAVFALAASTLLILAAVLGGLLLTQFQDQRDMEESLTAAELERERTERLLGAADLTSAHVDSAEGGSITVTYSAAEQMIHVMPHDVPAPAPDQTMQMWLIDDEGAESVGLMSGEEAELLEGMEFGEGVAFGVTIEPEGGSPEPTDDPIAVAEL